MRSFLLKCAALCLALTAVAARADIITFTVDTSGPSGIFYYDTSVPNFGINPNTGWYQVALDGYYIDAFPGQGSPELLLYNLASSASFGAPERNSYINDGYNGDQFDGVQLYTGLETGPVFTNGVYALIANDGNGDFGTITISGGTDLVVTPEPSSLLLLGTGILGMAGMARRRFRTLYPLDCVRAQASAGDSGNQLHLNLALEPARRTHLLKPFALACVTVAASLPALAQAPAKPASKVTGIAQNLGDSQVPARLEQVANSYTADNAFMGAVLVTNGEQVLLNKGFGMAVLEWNVPSTPATKFRLGSLTKQFTAALILLMQQDGKLNINDPVSKYLPDAPTAWEKITLANLLGHTSGIPNFTRFKEFKAWAASAHTWNEEYAFFKDKPLDFKPDTKFDYSNSNYEVLGGILERVSGKKYGDLLRERLFAPLGMNDSGLDTDELILPRRAEGYEPGATGLMVARSESMSVPFSAGSIYSTTGDLLKWEHGLFGGKVLSPDSLKAMTMPGKGGYGLGVGVNYQDGVKVVEHSGGIEGFNTKLIYVPEKSICVVVLANVNGSVPGQMGGQLLDVALGKTVILNSERKAEPITQTESAKFVGVYDLDSSFAIVGLYDLDSSFAITVAQSGNSLTAQGTRQTTHPMMYLGVKNGHARFFIAATRAEIEFVPDARGKIQSLIFHHNATDTLANRR